MSPQEQPEECPRCHSTTSLRPKLVLIDEAWSDAPGKDPRTKYFTDLRVDDVRPDSLKESPLEQFIDGFWCDRCGKAFVPERILDKMPFRCR